MGPAISRARSLPPLLTGPGPLDGPETSMAAFAQAVGPGYRDLETDVQVTADEVLAAVHDDRPGGVGRCPGQRSAPPASAGRTRSRSWPRCWRVGLAAWAWSRERGAS